MSRRRDGRAVELRLSATRTLNAGWNLSYSRPMSAPKRSETGEGYLGTIMVHRISRAVGVVESVLEARDGWPPEIRLKLADGTLRKGKPGDFREPTPAERKQSSP
jgi:hypothetical protein